MQQAFVHRRRAWLRRRMLMMAAGTLPVLPLLGAGGASAQTITETFDSDPAWIGLRNRSAPANPPIVTQNFGWLASNNAGGSLGELGGRIERTTRPAWYADEIPIKTFNDVLTAHGRIALPSQSTGGAFHFGWFNSERQGWRPWSAIGFRLDGQGGFSNILLDYMTQTWKAGGIRASSVNPSYTIPHNNSSHTWEMSYDPSANGGNGALSFRLDNLSPVTVNLDPGHKVEGATFNRFGVWNQQTPGGAINFFVDDVHYDGDANAFGGPAFGWEAHGNNTSFADPEQRGAHNFGYSNTNHAGGASPGEIGGLIWRPAVHAETYYADPMQQTLSLDMPLQAFGKVSLVRGATDGGLYFGWFNKESIENTVETQPQIAPLANFLAINIEGPSRIGHYFRPVLGTSTAERHDAQDGPVIFPDGAAHDFSLVYDPLANNGLGKVTVSLDGVTKEMFLTATDRAQGALFDHFGIFGFSPDGHYAEAYFDDLTYTIGLPSGPQWAGDASGNWHVASNWFGGIPNAVGATATFAASNTSGRTVYANSDVTVGTINFASPKSWLITGLGTLTLQTSSGSAHVNVSHGTHHINLPLVIASDTLVNVTGGSQLIVSDPVTVNAGRMLSHSGAGTVTYQSTMTLGSGATVAFGGSAALQSMEMAADATVDLSDGAALLIRDGDYAALRAQAMQSFNGGDWLGRGRLTSSDAAQDPHRARGIAVIENPAEWLGSIDGFGDLSGAAALIKQTWYGDTDLSGAVDFLDFERFVDGFDQHSAAASWLTGDFDFSGTVDAADFDRFLIGLQHQDHPAITSELFQAMQAFVTREGLHVDLSSIPEPGAAGLLGAVALALCRRRRIHRAPDYAGDFTRR